MISFGKNIRQANDPLNKIALSSIATKIINPRPENKALIDQLRAVAAIDIKKYRRLKVQLPYFVAAVFNPPFRKIENFAYTDYFIIDIDHLSDKNITTEELLAKFRDDTQIVLAFRSPGNDGIKVFFKLSESCRDAGKHTLFYKAFAQKFSQQYRLNQFIDKSTSDVSRACFYSYDTEAHYNPHASPVEMQSIIDFENELEIKTIEREIKDYHQETKPETRPDDLRQELPDPILQKIRETLNPNIKTRREKQIFVPEELDQILENLQGEMEKHQIKTENVKNINYGKQFTFSAGKNWAEINVFYGKKGFSVVKTTKTGSNQELSDICHLILCDYLYG